jgi:predicted dehydrogenase
MESKVMTRIQEIGVGIIGAGGWARYGHIPALRTLEEFELVAISSRRQEAADQLAEELHVPHAFGDFNDLIAHPRVDLVVIPTPGPEHAPMVRAAIAGGKDVYSEWPLTTSTAESEELLALAEQQVCGTSSGCSVVSRPAPATPATSSRRAMSGRSAG